MTTTTMPISATPRSSAAPLILPLPTAPVAAAALPVDAAPSDPFEPARRRFGQLVVVSAAAFTATCAVAVLAPSLSWLG